MNEHVSFRNNYPETLVSLLRIHCH